MGYLGAPQPQHFPQQAVILRHIDPQKKQPGAQKDRRPVPLFPQKPEQPEHPHSKETKSHQYQGRSQGIARHVQISRRQMPLSFQLKDTPEQQRDPILRKSVHGQERKIGEQDCRARGNPLPHMDFPGQKIHSEIPHHAPCHLHDYQGGKISACEEQRHKTRRRRNQGRFRHSSHKLWKAVPPEQVSRLQDIGDQFPVQLIMVINDRILAQKQIGNRHDRHGCQSQEKPYPMQFLSGLIPIVHLFCSFLSLPSLPPGTAKMLSRAMSGFLSGFIRDLCPHQLPGILSGMLSLVPSLLRTALPRPSTVQRSPQFFYNQTVLLPPPYTTESSRLP